MPEIDFDLSSTTARIIPKATKNLGVFHSFPGMIRLGAIRSISNPMGNTAPQQENPPAIVNMAGDRRRWFPQMNTPGKPNPIPRSAMVPSSNEPRRAARIAHAPASEHREREVAATRYDVFLFNRRKKVRHYPAKAWTPWTRSAGRPLCCFGEDQCDAPYRQWRAVRNGERMVARPDPRGWARIPSLPDQLAHFLWKATSMGCTSAGMETLSRRSIRLGGF
jgi:hypothetical protein